MSECWHSVFCLESTQWLLATSSENQQSLVYDGLVIARHVELHADIMTCV